MLINTKNLFLNIHLLFTSNVSLKIYYNNFFFSCVSFRLLLQNLFSRIFETTPAGISRKQFQHFGQLITSGKTFTPHRRRLQQHKHHNYHYYYHQQQQHHNFVLPHVHVL